MVLMDHLLVFIFILILLTGMWASVAAFQAAASARHTSLRWFASSLVALNTLVLLNLAFAYSSANLFAGYAELHASPLVHWLTPVARLGFLGLVYGLIRTSLAMQMAAPKPALERSLTRVFAVAAPLYLVAATLLEVAVGDMAAGVVDMIVMGALILMLVVLLIGQYRSGGRQAEPWRARLNRIFSLFYLAAFGLIIVANLMGEKTGYVPALLSLFALNLFPILWLRSYVRQEVRGTVPVLDDPILFEGFCEQHRLSNREREIAALIVQGKSNKEIEDLLFISLNTVKNHIYRMFRKIGVNSRSQFIHLLLQEQRNRVVTS